MWRSRIERSGQTLRTALLTAGPPTAVFIAAWLYTRSENGRISRKNRRQMGIVVGWIFLVFAVSTPQMSNMYSNAVNEFRGAVCATCALGLAMTTWRTMPAQKIAPLLLLSLSTVYVAQYAWHALSPARL